MTIIRQASCSCGQLRLTAQGEPIRISICHCLACQRRTGSVFGTQARFNREHIRITGNSKEYCRIADSGDAIRFYFCSECGATVYYIQDVEPDIIAVPVGVFADPDFPAPEVSVYEGKKHHWVVHPAAVKHVADN